MGVLDNSTMTAHVHGPGVLIRAGEEVLIVARKPLAYVLFLGIWLLFWACLVAGIVAGQNLTSESCGWLVLSIATALLPISGLLWILLGSERMMKQNDTLLIEWKIARLGVTRSFRLGEIEEIGLRLKKKRDLRRDSLTFCTLVINSAGRKYFCGVGLTDNEALVVLNELRRWLN